MFPYAPDPATAMTLVTLHGQELRAEAEAQRLARGAQEQRRTERRPARARSAARTRHAFLGWPRRAGAAH